MSIAENRRARFDYTIEERHEAGMVLESHHGRNCGYCWTPTTSSYISRAEYQSMTDFLTCFIQ